MQEVIKQASNKLIEALNIVQAKGFKHNYSFNIDCENLKDYSDFDIRESSEFKEIFKKLELMRGPVLYWFEIVSTNSNNDGIRQKLLKYSQSENSKSTLALKKAFDNESDCLYVGKVKRKVWGRMIQHMGFYGVNRTQGLQIFHWVKDLDLKLKVHLYEFEPEVSELISIFEIELAKRKKPIVGKH